MRNPLIVKRILLFPTVYNILNTPNGKKLEFLFTPTWIYLASLLSVLLSLLPSIIQSNLIKWFSSIRTVNHIETTKLIFKFASTLISSANVVKNILSMSAHEMQEIRDVKNCHIEIEKELFFYLGTTDGWVPSSHVQHIKATFKNGLNLN